ncbi:MAG: acyl-CoA dehydrogenase family protein [Dehalococcoidia bacterium]
MDLNLSPSEEAFRQEFDAWLQTNLPAELTSTRVRELGDDDAIAARKTWERKLGEGGWLGVSWPAEYGGRGATAMEHVLYLEGLLRTKAPNPVNTLGLNLVGPTIIETGTDAQKQRFLPPMLRGEAVWCQGFSEPNAGSDLAGLQTRAVRDGDDWVVNGQKLWSSGAHYADWCALLARTDADAPKHKGISFLLVDMQTPGVTVRPIKQISGDAEFNEIFFDNVRVPHEQILGETNGGWLVANRMLAYERGVITMEMLAGYQKLWDELRDFARATIRNGRPLIEDAIVRQRLARSWTDIQLMRLANLRYITQYMRGSQPGAETSYMKLYWGTTEQGLSDLTMSLGGPDALALSGSSRAIANGEWLRLYFLSRASTIYGGTEDIQRNIIADRVFGLPRG